MFAIPHFKLFALAVLMINITPGATFVAVTSESVSKGLKAGLFTAAGACAGLLVYALLTWLGLSALITGSPVAFTIIKYAGVAYLLYCGIKAFLQKPFDINAVEKNKRGESFKKGLFVNLLNPLTPVLFLTLIPQFISGTADTYSSQLLIMGLWICFSAFTVNIIWALPLQLQREIFSGKAGLLEMAGVYYRAVILIPCREICFF